MKTIFDIYKEARESDSGVLERSIDSKGTGILRTKLGLWIKYEAKQWTTILEDELMYCTKLGIALGTSKRVIYQASLPKALKYLEDKHGLDLTSSERRAL